jgi:hypothetical protein
MKRLLFSLQTVRVLVTYQILISTSMKMVVFWDVVPCSIVGSDQCFRGCCCLYHQGVIAQMKEAVSSSVMLVRLYQTTWCIIPEDIHLISVSSISKLKTRSQLFCPSFLMIMMYSLLI